jgi:hypothetical protein
MTNYTAYLKSNLLGIGMSRQELKLRAATCNSDSKKIVDAMRWTKSPPRSHVSRMKRS